MIFVDRHGTPVAIDTESASRSEVKLIEPLLAKNTLQKRHPSDLFMIKPPIRTRCANG